MAQHPAAHDRPQINKVTGVRLFTKWVIPACRQAGFITICTHDRENLFGEIKNGKMELYNAGKIIDYWLNKIPEKYNNVVLDQYQIMPNHLHGILSVGARSSRPKNINNSAPNNIKNPTLGQIIAFFKYESTKSINNLPGGKMMDMNKEMIGMNQKMMDMGGKTPPLRIFRNLKFWQRNFYERIIRDENEYAKICYYITHNPVFPT